MKIFRRPLTAGAVALGLTAALVVAAPATAADIYVEDSDIGEEGDTYPDSPWFIGANSEAQGEANYDFTEDGIVLTGFTQLLKGEAYELLEGQAHFIELIQSVAVDADGPWSFQIPIFYNSKLEDNLGFTTWRPADNSTTGGGLDDLWISSQEVTGIPATQGPATLEEVAGSIQQALEGGAPLLLSYGVLAYETGTDTTVRSITFDGDTHFFTPEPAEEEDPPVEEPPVEDPPVEDPPVEDPPAEDPPVEDPPAEDPPVEDPPVDGAPVDTPEPGTDAGPAEAVDAEATFTG